MKLIFSLWESAAADRDEPTSPKQPWLRRLNRGWSLLRRSSFGYEGREPLPQGRRFIADGVAPRATPGLFKKRRARMTGTMGNHSIDLE